MPPRSKVAHGGKADPGGRESTFRRGLTAEWRLMADLYALAIQTDRARFGSITYLAAGERLRMKGKYEYDGRTIYDFDDAKDLRASGSAGCSHEWWHKFNPSKKNEQLRAHAHADAKRGLLTSRKLSMVENSVEGNGRTILENSLITISTESGDGRHNDVKRELSGVFHAMTGANNRLKTGQILDVGAEGIDVYNTALDSMGVSSKLSPDKRDSSTVDKIQCEDDL